MSSNRVSILYLTADNADADVVGSLVGIVREVQGGRSVEQLVASAAGAAAPTAEAETDSPPLELPAPKTRRPRALRAAPADLPVEGARGSNVKGTVLAALRKNSRPDFTKLAQACYGSVDPHSIKKVQRALWNFSHKGFVKNNGDGSFTVIG